MAETKPVALRCGWCGHWEKGKRTKEQIAEWLRVHRNATLGQYDGDQELASTCPHPCGVAQEDKPCPLCNDTGTVPQTPGRGEDGPAPCPMCTDVEWDRMQDEAYQVWKAQQ